MFGTNTFLKADARAAHPYDFYRVRYVFAGAERLEDGRHPPDVMEKFGIRILEGYGTTETAPVLTTNTPKEYRTGTVGRFLPGIEDELVPVPGFDRRGHLHVRGPNMMLGYLRADAPGEFEPPWTKLRPGRYDTGDIVSVDAHGFVSVEGRVKRFAEIGGEWCHWR
jgi:acyl-[acyl-carrier-protein]-phospholipid O-acyltransferase / long-chain-fatty-acid--[acyl-carrier-protein] ligase